MNESTQPQSHPRTENFHNLHVSTFPRRWLPPSAKVTKNNSQVEADTMKIFELLETMSWTILYSMSIFRFSVLSFDVFDAWWHRIWYSFHFVGIFLLCMKQCENVRPLILPISWKWKGREQTSSQSLGSLQPLLYFNYLLGNYKMIIMKSEKSREYHALHRVW